MSPDTTTITTGTTAGTTITGTTTGKIGSRPTRLRFAMPFVTSLDGKVYRLDEETLQKCRIADEDVQKLGVMPPLPAPPAKPPPVSGVVRQEVVRVDEIKGG